MKTEVMKARNSVECGEMVRKLRAQGAFRVQTEKQEDGSIVIMASFITKEKEEKK